MEVQNNNFNCKAATAALPEQRFVAITKATHVATLTALGDDAEGVTLSYAKEAGDGITVHMPRNGDIYYVEAAAAIAKGAAVYPVADGKVDDLATGAGATVGFAWEAASAAGVRVPVLFLV